MNFPMNISKRERSYTLCCICNFSGKKNNKLVTCTLCAKNIHISIRCSAPYTSENSCSDDKVRGYAWRVSLTSRAWERKSPWWWIFAAPLGILLRNLFRTSLLIQPRLRQHQHRALRGSVGTLFFFLLQHPGNPASIQIYYVILVQEFNQIERTVNDLQVTVAKNAANIQTYKHENHQLAANNEELQTIIRSFLTTSGLVHTSMLFPDNNNSNNISLILIGFKEIVLLTLLVQTIVEIILIITTSAIYII